MTLRHTFAGMAIAALGLPALAAGGPVTTTTLDFEGIGDSQAVGSFYAAQGVTFGDRAIARIDADVVDEFGIPIGSGNFANEPSASTVLDFDYDPATEDDTFFSLKIDIAQGFNQSFSIWYSMPRTAGTVTLLDQSGGTIASASLSNTATNAPGDPFGGEFGDWKQVNLQLDAASQRAYSVVISGQYSRMLFDDMTFTNVVPEPSTYALMALGLGAVGFAARRRRAG